MKERKSLEERQEEHNTIVKLIFANTFVSIVLGMGVMTFFVATHYIHYIASTVLVIFGAYAMTKTITILEKRISPLKK